MSVWIIISWCAVILMTLANVGLIWKMNQMMKQAAQQLYPHLPVDEAMRQLASMQMNMQGMSKAAATSAKAKPSLGFKKPQAKTEDAKLQAAIELLKKKKKK
jgi:hypothetical protein